MRIQVVKTFLDGIARYESGETRVVSAQLGALAVRHGWATEVGASSAPSAVPADPVTLEIRAGRHAAGDNHG